jgi:hypothetical protein
MEFKNMRPDAPKEYQQFEAMANDESKGFGNTIVSTVWMKGGRVQASVKVQRYRIAHSEFNATDEAMAFCEQMVARLQNETRGMPKYHATEHALKIHQAGGYK